jgi:hypothetical protein
MSMSGTGGIAHMWGGYGLPLLLLVGVAVGALLLMYFIGWLLRRWEKKGGPRK